MRRLSGPRAIAPVAVLLALALVVLLAKATMPGAAPAAPMATDQSAAVTSVTRSCPPAPPGASSPKISMIALPGAKSATAGGAVTFSEIVPGPAVAAVSPSASSSASASGGAKPTTSGSARPTASGSAKPTATGGAKTAPKAAQPVTESTPGTATSLTAPGGGAAAVAASGQMAEGFAAEQTDTAGTGLVSCTNPGSDMWFAGTGLVGGVTQVRLYLMNTGDTPASANITVLTDTGEEFNLTDSITVAPGQSVSQDITPDVKGSQAVALHVLVGSGQVAAAVWEGGSGGGAWLPQADAPSTTVVVPGLTVAKNPEKLFIVVPGTAAAQVQVEAYTPAGAAAQFPQAPVEATGSTVTPVSLSALGASAAGLKLTANVPIVAAVLVPGAGVGSFTTGTAPVSGQGVVSGNPAQAGVTVGVLLTAPSAAAHATISVVSADGAVTTPAGDSDVTVAAGRTVAVAVARPAGTGRQPFAVVVTPQPGSGPLYAARVVTRGTGGLSAPLFALLPVQSALASIQLPPARNSYDAVLP